jgi:hypothetical protein
LIGGKPEPDFDWDQLDSIRVGVAQGRKDFKYARPPGTITPKDWAKRYEMSESSARRHLNEATKQGKMTRTQIGISTFYSLVKKEGE